MDINLKPLSIFILLSLILSGSQCSDGAGKIRDIPVSNFINECPDVFHDFGEMVSVGDPNDQFLIRIPYSWDIRESYTDSIYGVFASNFLSIPKNTEDQMSFSIIGYNTDKNLEDYFNDELGELLKDQKTKILERGSTEIDNGSIPWVLFEMNEYIFVMVFYIKGQQENDVYLLQTVSYDTVYYKDKLCQLKYLINTFELIKY